ncbi:transporter substrate-binding domain-containing protein [Streptomyces sp. NA04227]|uniref:protein kinase domain-containing protein n=1 Tax=Streptomyces sp. NA04227 TaxID=2742136 RepID=UPI001591F8C2|nr:transporter substrate-binding domain-containing protein [Streptomyces sp. NA04227]QKW08371.1 transporter substrate-binding domain-containing protein [Streptomyces sp. NA04227]
MTYDREQAREALRPLGAEDPREVSGYPLVARIGEGGMGSVYLSRTRGGQPVALKLIRREFAQDPDFRARFEAEVQAARRVSGYHIVPVLDHRMDGEQPWIASAYVPGLPLDDALAAFGPLPVPVVLQLVGCTAHALGSVHAASVIHRDLKPSNVLLSSQGPWVIDFGIARATDSTQLTRTGGFVGTPQFMSPEHALGRHVTPAADIFALGLIAAVAATGRHPYGDGAGISIAASIANTELRPPDLSGYPDALRPFLADCLAADPALRPTPAVLAERCEQASGRRLRDFAGWLPGAVAEEIQRRERAAEGYGDAGEGAPSGGASPGGQVSGGQVSGGHVSGGYVPTEAGPTPGAAPRDAVPTDAVRNAGAPTEAVPSSAPTPPPTSVPPKGVPPRPPSVPAAPAPRQGGFRRPRKRMVAAMVALLLGAVGATYLAERGKDDGTSDNGQHTPGPGEGTGDGNGPDGGGGGTAEGGVELVKDGVLTTCTQVPYPPFESQINGKIQGFDMDLTDLVAKELGVRQSIVVRPFETFTSGAAFRTGQCDVIAAAMTITPDRKRKLGVSQPYYKATRALVAAPGSGVGGVEDIKSKKKVVGVQEGTGDLEHAQKQGLEPEQFTTVDELLVALRSGRIDAAYTEYATAQLWIKDKSASGELALVDRTDMDQDYGFLVDKGNTELLAAVNDALAKARKDGTHGKLFRFWIEQKPGGGSGSNSDS